MVKFYTLLLVGEKPKHGYELMKELRERLEAKISPSQVYPFLNLLSRKGIVSAGHAGKREKKVYTLTRQGRELVEGLLVRFGRLAYLSVAPSLTVCAHCGCKVYGSAYTKDISGRKLAFCCRYCAGSFSGKPCQ